MWHGHVKVVDDARPFQAASADRSIDDDDRRTFLRYVRIHTRTVSECADPRSYVVRAV